MTRRLVVGTRGSALARIQTGLITETLQRAHPNLHIEIRKIKTLGDKNPAMPSHQAENPGIFVKELEDHLLRGEIDLAVHSLKDLPTEMPPGTRIAAIPPREDPRDVLVSRGRIRFEQLPSGAVLGTGSPRRKAQLLAARSDLDIQPIRGNVDTRLRKVEEGQYDATVLAAAGLHRLGRHDVITQYFPLEMILPEVGQGALALEVRADDSATLALLRPLNDPATEAAISAERAFLKRMGGGCSVPVTAYGRIENGQLVLDALLAAADGSRILRYRARGRLEDPEGSAQEAARALMEMGATELLAPERIPLTNA